LGIGYTGGSSILLLCLLATLGLWYWSLGSISVDTVKTPKVEVFYWAAITFSQTLGTALGDWMADYSTGLGYEGGAVVFGCRTGSGRGRLLLDEGIAGNTIFGLPSFLPGHWEPPLAIFLDKPGKPWWPSH